MEYICQEYIRVRELFLDNVFWNIKQLCLSVASADEVEGNYVSCDYMFPKQVNLFKFARDAKYALEIGFNAGHSAAIMLAANPNLHLVAFDLGEHPYVNICYEYLNKVFDGRITLILGDSKHTVAMYIRENKQSMFDLVHIDGGHDHYTAMSDILLTRILVNNVHNYVISDDDDIPILHKLHHEVTALGIWQPIDENDIMPMSQTSRHYIARFI